MEGRENDYCKANDEIRLEEPVREKIRQQVFKNVKVTAHRRFFPVSLAVCGVLLAVTILFIMGEKGGSGAVRGVSVVSAAEYPESTGFEESWDRWTELRTAYGEYSDELSDAIKQFAVDSAVLVLGQEKEENLCYSPVSFYTALAMAAETAQGQTKQEILRSLHYEKEGLANEMNLFLQLHFRDNPVNVTRIANSLWLNESMVDSSQICKDTADLLAEKYLVSSYTGDFAQEKTAKAMADWTAKQTKGLLGGKETGFQLDAQGVMTLISTIYYYDQWYDKFDASRNVTDTFTLSDGTQIQAEYMCTTRNPYGVLAQDGYTASTLHMKGSSSIMFVLPDEGVEPSDILSDPEIMVRLLGLSKEPEEQSAEVRFYIPKYSFKSSLDLTQTAKTLGIEAAFEPFQADFSGIVEGEKTGVWLSGIRQQTSMSIDEKGCEAAAFTQIDYAGAAMPLDHVVEFNLNRPFIIIVFSMGEPLFIGVVNYP